MNANLDRIGNVSIEFNLQVDQLEAPSENGEQRFYLPCENCHDLQRVPADVVSILCPDCYEEPEVQ